MRLLVIMMLFLIPFGAFGESAIPVPGNTTQVPEQTDTVNQASDIYVLPETAQYVEMSNSDFNRIVCPGVIQDIVVSKEKGVVVKYSGNNAFIKFKYLIKEGKPVYAKNPVELNIPCEGDMYTIIAMPKTLPASSKIRLSSGKKKKIAQNASVFDGMEHERNMIHFIRLAYTDKLPESFTITRPNQSFRIYKDMNIALRRLVRVEGEGLALKEYQITNQSSSPLKLSEKQFLLMELATQPLAISLSKLNLNSNDSARLFIVERTGGGRE